MEIITALVIPMEAGKRFKKEELIGIIQTHLNTHPMLKDNPRFTGLFGGRRDKENRVVSANVPSSAQHRQHQSGSAVTPAMSQPFSPSHANFTIPHGPSTVSTSSHSFNSLPPHHSLPAHYSHRHSDHNSVHSFYNLPPSQAQAAQYPSFQVINNNASGSNPF